jgi:hypothetical protein
VRFVRFIGPLVAAVACLGVTAGAANAQVALERASASSGVLTSATAAQVAVGASLVGQSGVLTKAVTAAACSHHPTIHGSNVNIRWTPNGRIIGRANWGERVTIGFYSGDWVFVTFSDRWSPTVGYVHQNYVRQPTCW